MRIAWIAAGGCIGLLGCGAPGEPGDAASDPRPSALLITIDTLRADHLGAYGHPEPVSPVIDALAGRGVVFERAIAASSRTAPSHASIFTSRFVRDHAIGYRNGSTRLGDPPTLAAQLAEHGYATAAFVSNTMLERRLGLDRGFEVYDDELPDRERNRLVFERRAGDTQARAVAWLREVEAPWLLWVHFNDPHGPYEPQPLSDAHEALTGPPVPGVPAEDAPLPVLGSQRGYHGIPAYQEIEGRRRPSEYRALYAREIRRVDDALAPLLEAAEAAAGGEGRLVVLLTSDHGESLGEHGFYFGHGHATTRELVHVPFIVTAPGLAPARRSEVVHHVDVAPTLLQLLGVPALPGAAGHALAPVARGETELPARTLFADVGAEVTGYRGALSERWRLRGDLGETPEGSRERSRWDAAGSTPRDEERALAEALGIHASKRPPFLSAPAPDEEAQERLRALGYVEPGGKVAEDAR